MEILGEKLLERGRFAYVSRRASMYRPVRLRAGLLAAKDPDRVLQPLEFTLSSVNRSGFVSRIRFRSEQLDGGSRTFADRFGVERSRPASFRVAAVVGRSGGRIVNFRHRWTQFARVQREQDAALENLE